MKITNKSRNIVLAENAVMASSLFARMKGLLGSKGLAAQEALILKPCNSVHTFFMQFAIDVLFVDGNNRIVGIKSCLKPFRLSRVYLGAKYAVELSEGAIESTLTSLGDILTIE